MTIRPCRSRPPAPCPCPGRSRTWCPRCSTRSRPRRAELARAPLPVLAGGVLALVAAGALSLLVGARSVGPETVWQALAHFDQDVTDHVVIRSRLQRTVAGIAVGAALAVAGAAMQGMTRNPLADPGILGLNAGASAAVVLGIAVASVSQVGQFMVLAFAGAAVGTVLVYAVASLGRDGATPVKLALAGAAITA